MKAKIIGAGSIGNHLAQASRRMGWQVTVVDCDAEALRRMKEEIYPGRYGSWDESIELFTRQNEPIGGFDIIFIGTPPHVRMDSAIAALKEKPKVLQLEKPLCTPLLDGLEEFLSVYSSQQETIAVVGYDHAISQSIGEVVSLVRQGTIGEVETLDVEFREHWQGIFAAHSWLSGPEDSYLGYWRKGGGASGEHSHALHLWLLLAKCCGTGNIAKISSFMDMRTDGRTDYDAVAAFTFFTEKGRIGRVIQDVVSRPFSKKIRIQGKEGFLEWLCNGHPEGDIVRCRCNGQELTEKIFKKKRPDDFYFEMLHIQSLMEGAICPLDSPIAVESGIEVMKILSQAHKHRNGSTF